MFEVRDTPLSVDEVLRAVADPAAGGTCVFVGAVRDNAEDRAVRGLTYEAHPQAAQALAALGERLLAEDRVVRIAMVHRVGELAIGDLAVVVAVSAGHRTEAFEVCRQAIDELKATVPVWKHEFFDDGTDVWVGAP